MIGTPNTTQESFLRLMKLVAEGATVYLSPGCHEWGHCPTEADIPKTMPDGYIVLNADNLLGTISVPGPGLGDEACWDKLEAHLVDTHHERHGCAEDNCESPEPHECEYCETLAKEQRVAVSGIFKNAGLCISEY